ncbi:TM2 domain-containing protein [Mangrovimonas sp. TPBH4]|uniref:TM2 domain-containing protein n=1 Tax=Mangrovimonas sp. TPBH4 TaxID=1645914 RepID=UPI0009E8C52A|nr:TM2 domain-containing protein [Mangrovimonas sp. TPBH4]
MSDEKSLGDDLNEMLGDAKKTAKKAADKAEEFGKEAKDSAKEFGKEAEEATREFRESAKEAFEKTTGTNKKVLAGVTAILLGGFGIHKFVLGYNKEGLILLIATIVLSVLSFGFLGFLVWVFTVIEGIIYLTKTDGEFYKTYQLGKKPWF